MEAIAITIGTMIMAAFTIVKIHDANCRRDFEVMKAEALAKAEEQIAKNRYNREHPQPAEPNPEGDKFVRDLLKVIRKRDEEKKQLRKWQHYAQHAKKWRIRNKYQKKIRDYYSKHPLHGGYWYTGAWSSWRGIPGFRACYIEPRLMGGVPK